nr:ABC transporter ATP-binding protein [Candidatus Njordarchaeum guaymaensis]
MPIIKLKNVTKKFRKVRAIDNLSLVVNEGEYLCVLGPTGAGKTTLLKLLAGVLKPNEGKIYFDNKIMNDVPPEDRNVALVYQSFALFPHLTVLGNVLFGPLSRGIEYREAFKIGMDTLEMVKLARRAKSYPNELSGGMQQRIALARSLASGAKTLLMDEPLGALDARLRIELRYDLRNLVKDLGLTAIHVTHDQEEAVTIGDRIALLRDGKLEQVDTPIEFYNHPKSIFSASFLGGANLLEGVIKKVTRKGSAIDLGAGNEVTATCTNYREGKLVVLSIRPEKTKLDTKPPRQNCLEGKVDTATFLGNLTRYDIKLKGVDETIASKVPSRAIEQLKPGENVYVTFDPEDCVVFSSPRQGLYKEIAAI